MFNAEATGPPRSPQTPGSANKCYRGNHNKRDYDTGRTAAFLLGGNRSVVGSRLTVMYNGHTDPCLGGQGLLSMVDADGNVTRRGEWMRQVPIPALTLTSSPFNRRRYRRRGRCRVRAPRRASHPFKAPS